MVCGLLANTLENYIVGPVEKEAVDEAMGFLAERLAAVQSLALGKEQIVVVMLVETIPQIFRG